MAGGVVLGVAEWVAPVVSTAAILVVVLGVTGYLCGWWSFGLRGRSARRRLTGLVGQEVVIEIAASDDAERTMASLTGVLEAVERRELVVRPRPDQPPVAWTRPRPDGTLRLDITRAADVQPAPQPTRFRHRAH